MLPTAARTAAAANDETRHGSPAGSTSPRTPQHDVEEMAKQAVDQRASSQGSLGMVPRSHWRRERGTRWRHGHGGAEQGAGRARTRSERDASVGDASSSEAERAGGSSEQVVRTRDTCAWMASRAQPTAAVAQAHAAQRAGNADRVVTAPSASLVMCTTFKAARIFVRHVPNANLIS